MKKVICLLSMLSVLFLSTKVYTEETINHYYEKNRVNPQSSYEQMLINHVIASYDAAINKKSKLNGNVTFASNLHCNSSFGVIPYYHLLNNLCSLIGGSHLHVGLYAGGSFVSALYENENILKQKIGVEHLQNSSRYKKACDEVCNQHLQKDRYQIVRESWFLADKSIFSNPIDVYVYDADHSLEAHEMAFTYYDEVFADVFIAVVDDWNWEQVRKGTFSAFEKLGYRILYENEIPSGGDLGNGQYLAVIKKTSKIKFAHRTHPYYTHQPVLYEIASKTTGPMIEFGCGHGSTDMLHEICKENNRFLISIDDDLDWLSKFSKKYQNDSEWHKFIFVPGKKMNDLENPEHWVVFLENCELLQTIDFDVCFVDQSPWAGRFETIKYMKDKVKYIILHDCDYFPTNKVFGKTISPISNRQPGIFDFSDIFRYSKVYFPLQPWPGDTGPPTLLGSDFESDLPDVDFNKY